MVCENKLHKGVLLALEPPYQQYQVLSKNDQKFMTLLDGVVTLPMDELVETSEDNKFVRNPITDYCLNCDTFEEDEIAGMVSPWNNATEAQAAIAIEYVVKSLSMPVDILVMFMEFIK